MSKKILSIIIPCYNGESFLNQSIHSIANDRIFHEQLTSFYEVIIIDDGSKDNSLQVARKLARELNEKAGQRFIRVIKKENGQYGSVINRGLKEAKGIYFKVLDVDDALSTVHFIDTLYILLGLSHLVDVVFTDHTYEKVGINLQELQTLNKWFLPNKITKLSDVECPSDLITMHSIIYRTQLLKDIKYHQLEKVYYSDSIYSLIPLSRAQSMYYIPLPLYRYYIGREDQSISLKTMVKNRLHQLLVLEEILKQIDFDNISFNKIKKYNYVAIKRIVQWQIMLIAHDFTLKHPRQEIFKLIQLIKKHQPKHYKMILKGPLCKYIKIFRGIGLTFVIKHGLKVYSLFNKNILAEWDN